MTQQDTETLDAIPAGMKPWHGGENAPDDWDSGPVRLRDGTLWRAKTLGWQHEAANPARDIIAYTPKPPAGGDCPSSPDGQHQVDTSMESGPNSCFHCEAPMGGTNAR